MNRIYDIREFYGKMPKKNHNIRREILIEDIQEFKIPVQNYFYYIFKKIDFINLILPLLLASSIFWLNFYWVTILVLCFIFFLLYFYTWNSTASSIERSIDNTYEELIFLNKSYIKLLKENILILKNISNLPEINSNIFNTNNNDISYKLLNNINYNLRDYSLLSNNYFILPFLNYIQFQKKLIKNEHILLNLVKNNLNLRKTLTVDVIKSFKLRKKKNYLLNKNYFTDNKHILTLSLYLKFILEKN